MRLESSRRRGSSLTIRIEVTVYGQVTLIKANRSEAMGPMGTKDTGPLALARHTADEQRCSVAVTYGGHGIVAAVQDGGIWYLGLSSGMQRLAANFGPNDRRRERNLYTNAGHIDLEHFPAPNQDARLSPSSG